LGEVLDAWFHNTPGVVIKNSANLRKYEEFGKVMILYTHGNRGKLAEYPGIMAVEEPEMWGRTTFREAHTGDKHQDKTIEIKGVKVRIFSALCPPDAWHSDMQFVGNQQSAEALMWHRECGQVGASFFTVPRKERAA
jgi:hypothetical protein